jgi:hypothetical protein
MEVVGVRLVHYSDTPVPEVRSVAQPIYPSEILRMISVVSKPEGLWLSVEGFGRTWPDYCKVMRCKPGRLRYAVRLAPGAKVLRLSSADDLDAFTERYGFPDADTFPGKAVVGVDDPMAGVFGGFDRSGIDWPKVAAEHQGIIIAPFVWSRRLHLAWYYGWDCASGCIWDAAAVASIKQIVRAGASPTAPKRARRAP